MKPRTAAEVARAEANTARAARQQEAMDAAPLFMFCTGYVGRISIVQACAEYSRDASTPPNASRVDRHLRLAAS